MRTLIFFAFLGIFSTLIQASATIALEKPILKKLIRESAPSKPLAPTAKKIDSLPTEKLEIITKDNRIIVRTKINKLDLRPIVENFLKPKKEALALKPLEGQKKTEAKKGVRQILDLYLDINEAILPREIVIRDINSFMIYHHDSNDKSYDDMFALIKGLSSDFNVDLLFKIQQLNLSGKLVNQKKITDLQINLTTVNDKMKTILVRSTDPQAMMKILGLDVFEGNDYVFHAQWAREKSGWNIKGAVEMENVFIKRPPIGARILSGVLSLQGLINSVTSSKIYFKKLKLFFVVKNGKRKFVCEAYFGERIGVPCGSF